MADTKRALFDNWPYMRGWEERHGEDRFTYVETGPAVSVIPICRDQAGAVELILIQEYRPETGQTHLKAVGAYLREDDRETAARKLIQNKAGIRCEEFHLLVPAMEGFTTVRLPIATLLGLRFAIIGEGSAKRVRLTLEEAVELVLRQEIPDQCNADAIMRIALLEARGRLPL